MATARQLARTRAQTFQREYRVFCGPRRGFVTAALFEAGQPATLPDATWLTAGIDGIDATAITIPVGNTTGFPASGMIMVGTVASILAPGITAKPTAVDWFTYAGKTATSFTGCRWVHGDRERHSRGERVTMWHDISDRVDAGSVRVSEFEDGPFLDWQAEIAGTRYHSGIMMPDATVLIVERLAPEAGVPGGYTNWLVAAVGYVREWRSEGDKDGVRRWSATVESVSTYIKAKRITARRYGRTNLAETASVTASAALADPSLEPAEFAGGLGSTDASNIIDGNPDTGYVSALAPTATDRTVSGTGSARIIFDEIIPFGPIGAPGDLQVIVIRLPTYSDYYGTSEDGSSRQLNLSEYCITNKQTLYIRQSPEHGPPIPYANYIRLTGTLSKDNPILVLCRNRDILERYYHIENVQALDWRTLSGFGNDHLTAEQFRLDPNGDWLQLRQRVPGGETAMHDMVMFGRWSDPWASGADRDANESQWPGTTAVTLGARGTSIRRVNVQHDTNAPGDWEINPNPVPGMDRAHTEPIWIDIDLGEFTITLGQDITAGYTGAVTVSGGTEFLDPFGTIQIDLEQISYKVFDASTIQLTARGRNGTTAAAHLTGAIVKLVNGIGDYDAMAGGGGLGAHRLHDVAGVHMIRARAPVIRAYELWGSTLVSPRHPGDANYDQDWLGQRPLVSNSYNTALRIDPVIRIPLRLRHLMIVIKEMSDRGRAKLSEVRVWPSVWFRPGDGDDVPEEYKRDLSGVYYDLLREVLDPGEITIQTSAHAALHLTTSDISLSEGRLGDVLSQLLDETMCVIRFTTDGRAVVSRAPTYPGAPAPAVRATYTAEYIRSPHTATRPSRILLGQMVVNVETPEGRTYVGRYPSQPGPGEIEHVTLRRHVGSVAEANLVAEMLYWQDERISDSYTFTTMGPAEYLHVGDRLLIEDWSDEANQRQLVNVRVTAVEHGGPDGTEVVEVTRWTIP